MTHTDDETKKNLDVGFEAGKKDAEEEKGGDE